MTGSSLGTGVLMTTRCTQALSPGAAAEPMANTVHPDQRGVFMPLNWSAYWD